MTCVADERMGGVRKDRWTSIPQSLACTVVNANGFYMHCFNRSRESMRVFMALIKCTTEKDDALGMARGQSFYLNVHHRGGGTFWSMYLESSMAERLEWSQEEDEADGRRRNRQLVSCCWRSMNCFMKLSLEHARTRTHARRRTRTHTH